MSNLETADELAASLKVALHLDRNLSKPKLVGEVLARAIRTLNEESAAFFVAKTAPLVGELFLKARAFDALQVTFALEQIVQPLRAAPLRWRVANMAGVILADSGDITSALIRHGAALKIAERQRNRQFLVSTWNNACIAFMRGNAILLARECATKAVHFAGDEFSELKYVNLVNLAQCEEHLGNVRAAIVASHAAFRMESEHMRKTKQFCAIQLRSRYACLLARQGRCRYALRCVKAAQVLARGLRSPRATIAVRTAAAMVDFFSAKPERGLMALRKLLETARKIPATLTDVLTCLAKCEEQLGNRERASVYYEQLHEHRHHLAEEQARQHLVLAVRQAYESPPAPNTDPAKKYSDIPLIEWEQLERLSMRAALAEHGDPWHNSRVGELVERIAIETGMAPGRAREMGLAARLYDIGTLGIPAPPRAITRRARDLSRSHTRRGHDMLQKCTHPRALMAANVALYHHERWDGKGFPKKIRGKAIPFEARVCALAIRINEILSRCRSMRGVVPGFDNLILSVRLGAGTEFDPEIAAYFIDSVTNGTIRRYLMSDPWRALLHSDHLSDLLRKLAEK